MLLLAVFSCDSSPPGAAGLPTSGGLVRPQGGGGQQLVCHCPPGGTDGCFTIAVDAAALAAHLGHGDALGPCPGEHAAGGAAGLGGIGGAAGTGGYGGGGEAGAGGEHHSPPFTPCPMLACGRGRKCCSERQPETHIPLFICADLQTNPRHCGACGKRCGNFYDCCDGKCASYLFDVDNCGGCGRVCAESFEFHSDAKCVASTCCRSTRSMDFNGSNDRVDMGFVADFNFDSNESFSLCAWVKTTSTTAGAIIGAQRPQTPSNEPPNSPNNHDYRMGYLLGFGICDLAGQLPNVGADHLCLTLLRDVHPPEDIPAGWAAVGCTPAADLHDGQWHLVCGTHGPPVVVNGDTLHVPAMQLYVDGVLRTTNSWFDNLAGNSINYMSASFAIGATVTAVPTHHASCHFDGRIDEAAVWNVVLSPAEVASIHDGSGAFGCPQDLMTMNNPPIGWWRMGDGYDSFMTMWDNAPPVLHNGGVSNTGLLYVLDSPP